MANPLMGNSQNGGNPLGNALSIISQFKKFKEGYKGNPQQEVQDLLNSGQMTQEQFEQLQNTAMKFKGILF